MMAAQQQRCGNNVEEQCHLRTLEPNSEAAATRHQQQTQCQHPSPLQYCKPAANACGRRASGMQEDTIMQQQAGIKQACHWHACRRVCLHHDEQSGAVPATGTWQCMKLDHLSAEINLKFGIKDECQLCLRHSISDGDCECC